MALSIVEFFGFAPLDPAAAAYRDALQCPFVASGCIKPRHGSCSLALLNGDPIICCPNRLYAESFAALRDIATEAFGTGSHLILDTPTAHLQGPRPAARGTVPDRPLSR